SSACHSHITASLCMMNCKFNCDITCIQIHDIDFHCACYEGKSVSVCYLIYRLIKDYPSASIVLVDYKRTGHKFMLFTPTAVFVASTIDAFVAELSSPNNFVIYDMGGKDCPSVADAGIAAQIIVISSANPAHFDTFHRTYKYKLVTTTWSSDECKEASETV